MPVLSPAGVVGRVLRISGPYADVQLTTDPRTSIDVVLPRTGSRGVLKGVASDSRYLCRVEYVLHKETSRSAMPSSPRAWGPLPRATCRSAA